MTETPRDFDRYILKIDWVLHAPRAAVWRCWTEPDLFRQWFCRRPGRFPKPTSTCVPAGG